MSRAIPAALWADLISQKLLREDVPMTGRGARIA
jgi:hypothetical protein